MSEWQTTQESEWKEWKFTRKSSHESHSEAMSSTEHHEEEFFKMHKVLFEGTVIFSGGSRIKRNLGEELNVTSLPPPVLLNIL